MKSRKSRSTRLREKAVTVIQAWARGFLTRRVLQRLGQMPNSRFTANVCVSAIHSRKVSIAEACIELYDAFSIEAWPELLRKSHRSSIVVYEEPIELSSKRPLQLLDYEEDDSRHFVYYDDLNRSRLRTRGVAGSTPLRSRRHSPYESGWNQRILQDFYNVKVPVTTMLVKRTQSRLLLDTASTPLTRLKHRIKRSHSTSTKNSSDDGDKHMRRPQSRVLDTLDPQVSGKLRYSPKQKGTPARRRPGGKATS